MARLKNRNPSVRSLRVQGGNFKPLLLYTILNCSISNHWSWKSECVSVIVLLTVSTHWDIGNGAGS